MEDRLGSEAESGSAADRAEPTFEAARDELVEVVNRLEAGGTTLEEALALWERGERLVTTCEAILARAKERIEAVRGAGS